MNAKVVGPLVLGGVAVLILYFLSTQGGSSGPLSNQPSILQRLFPGLAGASGQNPSPLTQRNLAPANYTLPATPQQPVGTSAVYAAAGASALSSILSLFTGRPASTPSTSQIAAGGSGVAGGSQPISNAEGGLLQGPTAAGTPLSVSAGWQPTDSAIQATNLQPPPDLTIGSSINLDPSQLTAQNVNIDPLTGDVISGVGPNGTVTSLYPGYDSTIPVDPGVVSLPDATTPDLIVA